MSRSGHTFPTASSWVRRLGRSADKVPEILRARSRKGVARMEQREQPSGGARMTSDLFDAYCLGQASDLYGGHFGSQEDRRRAVMRALRPVDADVADALAAQQARFYPSAARTQHVTALRRGAAAVVTGQQAGLFLGPLYT